MKLLLATFLFLFASCAKNIHVFYQTESTNTGSIMLIPTRPTEKAYVTINDNLIVDKKNVKSVMIENVPEGNYSVHYTSDNSWYKDKLDSHIDLEMVGNHEMTKLIEVPPYSTGYWVFVTAITLLPLIISLVSLSSAY